MDALEFVDELEGSWDCIIFDPPYFKDKEFSKDKTFYSKRPELFRTSINQDYLNNLKQIILSKTNKCFFVSFNNVLNCKYDYLIIWYKGKKYGGIGGYIMNNHEFIYIDKIGDIRPNQDNTKRLKFIEEIEQLGSAKKELVFSKPFELIKKILLFCNAAKVLDPFAGSYITYKVCMDLGIEIDSCDKYIDPPKYKSVKLSNWT